MKNIFFVLFMLISVVTVGQYPVTHYSSSDSTLEVFRGAAKSRLVNWIFVDTTQANTTRIKQYPGAQIVTTSDESFWFRNSLATKWIFVANISGGGGGGGGTVDTLYAEWKGGVSDTRTGHGVSTFDSLIFYKLHSNSLGTWTFRVDSALEYTPDTTAIATVWYVNSVLGGAGGERFGVSGEDDNANENRNFTLNAYNFGIAGSSAGINTTFTIVPGQIAANLTDVNGNSEWVIGQGSFTIDVNDENSPAIEFSKIYLDKDSLKFEQDAGLYMFKNMPTGSVADSAIVLNRATGEIYVAPVNTGGGENALTFRNGLTRTVDTVELGGTLIKNTTITGGSNTFDFTGSGSYVVKATGTGTPGFYGVSTTAVAGRFESDYSTTNAIQEVAQFLRTTSGTASTSMGGRINLRLETSTAAVNQTAVLLDWVWNNATNGAQQGRFDIYTNDAGTLLRKFSIDHAGELTLDKYGAGTFTGTEAKLLAVTSTGVVIEVDR